MTNNRRVAVLAHANCGDSGARKPLESKHVVLCVLGQILKLLGFGDVLGPTREHLIDRLRVVEIGLGDRNLVHPLAVHLVCHANRDFLDASKDIEFG